MLKGKLGLSNTIVEKTAYIYRKVVARRLVRGRTIPGMLVACLYLASHFYRVHLVLPHINYNVVQDLVMVQIHAGHLVCESSQMNRVNQKELDVPYGVWFFI